jgi:hypothetical protein
MKTLSILCVALCIGISTSAAFARGGGMGSHASGMSVMGLHPPSITGGAMGTSAATPGTNSLGTALSSDAMGNGPVPGEQLGTSPAVEREEARVNKMMSSICRGC